MKSFSVIIILSTALLLISKGQVYLGFVLMLFTFFTVIKFAASSVYGDFSKTAEEIKAIVKSRKKVDINYLSYPEQIALKEEYRQQGIKDRERMRANRKLKSKRTRRIHHSTSNLDVLFDGNDWDDNLIVSTSTDDVFANDDNYYIDNTICNTDAIEETYVNPTTGMIMIGGIGGIDAGGHFWCESDSFDDSFSDSFSSIDDSFSLDDSSDCFSTGMDDW